MSAGYQIVVLGSLVPDPLQSLEPVPGPALKNESMLPSVLDPWAAHALYEAAHLAKQVPGSKVWLVSLGPKPKLQQLMMTVAQKVPFELVALDGSAGGFTDPVEVSEALAGAVSGIQGLDKGRLLLFGGCASASRDAGCTVQMVGERLKVRNQFAAVDEVKVQADGSFRILERIEAGKYQVSVCAGPPAAFAWATGSLPEPPNNPQVGIQNMRAVMPALQKAAKVQAGSGGATFVKVELPVQQRKTRIVKDVPAEEIARELADWIKG